MLTKILMMLLLGFSVTALAAGDKYTKPINKFDGFYVGVGAGFSYTMSDMQNTLRNIEKVPAEGLVSDRTYNLSEKENKASFSGDGFVGYGYTFTNNIYFAGEIFGRYYPNSDLDTTASSIVDGTSASTEITVKSEGSLGAAARGGYLIAPNMLIYGLVGVDAIDARVDVIHKSAVKIPTSDSKQNNLDYDYLYDDILVGIMPGIGFEFMATKHLSFRLQDTFSFYLNDASGSGQYPLMGTTRKPDLKYLTRESTSSTEVKLSRNVVLIEAAWHF